MGPRASRACSTCSMGRRQLIVYRAFLDPGVSGWPEHACIGCSMVADQVADVAHLNARDTTLVFVSRAPQLDIERVKARMGWEIPWCGQGWRRQLKDHLVNTGSASHPRTVEVGARRAFSQSTSQLRKRASTSSSATRPSSLASAAPRQ